MSRPPPPDSCANCGANIPAAARACPDCGADERTGWREASVYDGLDLPDEAYEENPGPATEGRSGPRGGIKWYWLAAAALLVLLLGLRSLGWR